MTVELLDQETARILRAAPYTYAHVGATGGDPPADHRWFSRTAVVGRDLDAAAADLFAWRVQERSGLRVWTSELPLTAGTVVLMRLGPGRASIRIPCRVLEVIEEEEVRGFSYGTLPGHPESGEERFVLHRDADGAVWFTVTAFSQRASRLARAGGPLTARFQDLMTRRYLRALRSA